MSDKRKIPYLNFIPLLIIAFLLYKVINKIDLFLFMNINLLSIFSPVIWAFAIAYLLNPLMNYIEIHLKAKRIWSILIIYMLVIGIATISITIVSPKVFNSVANLIKDLDQYFEITNTWVTEKIDNLKLLDKYGITPHVENSIKEIMGQASSYLNHILTAVVSKAINLTSTFFRIILSMIISVYFLKDKERFIHNLKKIIIAFFNKDRAKKIMEFGVEVDKLFSQFIIGKFIDSCIIGGICFIGLMIIKAPYGLLLSLIIGLTNMIPYFGPFIGAVPAVAITLFDNPIKAIWVLVFIIALQQFDGLFLGPMILGDKVGLSPFWIILAIIIGGGMFGVVGMFLGVPIMAVIKILLEKYINKKLEAQNIKL
ncbi:AI-2E family transporter [Paramaledivibacter caminithermalis]|jgi:predicted PurR-regulated permease PerM|uniref:Predicted PurR-regulated permease PerM n=1 Tax=Paramaledivibacter caminithermalis (strain DSM 15212 / CIP 107654 / DViRD3) TaxID=1121301 RepID=A0A1M6KU56_PARC5|nr:AI-2E family transporter [Paramaledivibacter caminithermalis]SHJ62473.1 Predicted PurR-regulated permease PerM [Paramaledivibacter caminithermalis DSM 15212]